MWTKRVGRRFFSAPPVPEPRASIFFTRRASFAETTKEGLMFAIIKTGGKQYRVTQGETLRVEKLLIETGGAVEFTEVLLVAGEGVETKIGLPTLAGAKVVGKVVAQERGPKITIFKFKRRKNYRRKSGHRQSYTAVRIETIQA